MNNFFLKELNSLSDLNSKFENYHDFINHILLKIRDEYNLERTTYLNCNSTEDMSDFIISGITVPNDKEILTFLYSESKLTLLNDKIININKDKSETLNKGWIEIDNDIMAIKCIVMKGLP